MSTLDEIRAILDEWDAVRQKRSSVLKALGEACEAEVKALDDRRKAAKASLVAASAADTARRNNEIRRTEREFESRIRDVEHRNREARKSLTNRVGNLESIEAKIPKDLYQKSAARSVSHKGLFEDDDYDELLRVVCDRSLLSSAKRLLGSGSISPVEAAGKIKSMLEHDRRMLKEQLEIIDSNSEVESLKLNLKSRIEEIESEENESVACALYEDKRDYEIARRSIRENYAEERARVEAEFANKGHEDIAARCRNIALRGSEALGCAPKQLSLDYAYPRSTPKEIFDYWRLIEIGEQRIPVPHSYELKHPSSYLFVTKDYIEAALRCMRSMVAFQIKMRPFSEVNIIWLDTVSMGMSLGVLAELASPVASEEETLIKVASSQREIDLAISKIEGEMGLRSLRVASSGNLWDYNDNANNRIPNLIVVGIGLDNKQYDKRCVEALARAAGSSSALGIQVISSIGSLVLPEEETLKLEGLAESCEIIEMIDDLPIQQDGEDRYTLLFPGEKWIKAHLVDPLLSRSSAAVVDNEPMPDKTDIDGVGLRIPLGWRPSGEIAYLDYSDYAHAFLAGRTGSGKSVFLHNAITKACERYSPEELEICLIDYKKSEFGIYRDDKYCFPNIIFIGLDNTKGFVDALMKYLVKIFNDRQELINEDNSRDIGIYNKTHDAKIPRLLIIMDEFHRQSSLTDYAGESARSLEFLLRESRAYGMHFLIADQEIGNLDGLSDPAKKQLGGRIQLDWTETSELTDMFELAGYDLGVNKLDLGKAVFKIDGDLEICTWPFVSEEDIASSKAQAILRWNRNAALTIQDSAKPLNVNLSELPILPNETIPIGTAANFLEPIVGLALSRRRRENLFILNKDAKKTVDLVCSIALGFVKSRNAGRIVLMCLEDDLFYSGNVEYWNSLSSQCEFEALVSLAEICSYCKSEPDNGDFLVIVGIDSIAEAFEDVDEDSAKFSKQGDKTTIGTIDDRLESLLRMEEGIQTETVAGDNDDELVFDARSDLLGIIKRGGSKDIHTCAVSDRVFGLYSVFGAGAVQEELKDLFPYRIAPSCDYSEAVALGLMEAASNDASGDNVYMVTKTGSKEEFRPFDIRL